MRILYVYDTLALWGGIERIFVNKMNALVSMYGYEVYMLTANQGDHSLPFKLDERIIYEDMAIFTHHQYRYRGPRRYYERWQRNRLLCRKLKEKIAEINPDIIVSTTSRYIPQLLQVKGKIPLVSESHSGYDHVLEFDKMTWWRRFQVKRLYQQLRKTDVLVALTEEDAHSWRMVHPNVRVIPNMTDFNHTGHYSTCERKQALFVGRFAMQKGIEELLKIWQLVHQRYPDWELHIYGEGELKPRFEREVADMPDCQIYIHQPVSNIIDQYLGSSMLLVTSIYEPFGLVIVEAMSCGLPVVSFKCPYGPENIITDGQDGLLVKERDVHVFADRICQLIENKQLRQHLGERAVVSAQRYSSENVLPMWKSLFEELTGVD